MGQYISSAPPEDLEARIERLEAMLAANDPRAATSSLIVERVRDTSPHSTRSLASRPFFGELHAALKKRRDSIRPEDNAEE